MAIEKKYIMRFYGSPHLHYTNSHVQEKKKKQGHFKMNLEIYITVFVK